MTAILALAAVALGIACILADQHISRVVLRKSEEADAGAASTRMLGLILFVAGGLAFLTWTP